MVVSVVFLNHVISFVFVRFCLIFSNIFPFFLVIKINIFGVNLCFLLVSCVFVPILTLTQLITTASLLQ